MKTMLNPKVNTYLNDGCMQCELGATPGCKIHNWQKELLFLRDLILSCGLDEDFKWMHPCYTHKNKNIVLMHTFNDYCALLFPKGVLLSDQEKILVQQTENSQTARQIRFQSLNEIIPLKDTIRSYIFEMIELEESGAKVQFKKTEDFDIPEELKAKFIESPTFKKAFYSLTPGRQRGYLLHFSQPKQSATKIKRIEKSIEKIFEGKGLNDY